MIDSRIKSSADCVRIPNPKTMEAIRALDAGNGKTSSLEKFKAYLAAMNK